MREVGSLGDCKRKVEQDVHRIWNAIDAAVQGRQNAPLDAAVFGLAALRRSVYEDLNQIQHEFAILKAIEWCTATSTISSEAVWWWNPRATGDIGEPDLAGMVGDEILLSAEVTTSHSPQGVIDRRMAHTLSKLSMMAGQQFYFVTSAKMARRAKTKVLSNGYAISVVDLSDESIVSSSV